MFMGVVALHYQHYTEYHNSPRHSQSFFTILDYIIVYNSLPFLTRNKKLTYFQFLYSLYFLDYTNNGKWLIILQKINYNSLIRQVKIIKKNVFHICW